MMNTYDGYGKAMIDNKLCYFNYDITSIINSTIEYNMISLDDIIHYEKHTVDSCDNIIPYITQISKKDYDGVKKKLKNELTKFQEVVLDKDNEVNCIDNIIYIHKRSDDTYLKAKLTECMIDIRINDIDDDKIRKDTIKKLDIE